MAVSRDPSRPSRKPSPYNSYLRYSGLAIQLMAAIAIMGWLGYKVDGWLNVKYPIFMLALGLVGFAGSLYQVYKSINRK